MKEDLLEMVLSSIGRLSARTKRRRTRKPLSVVVAPGAPGSIGDTAMMAGLTQGLRARGVEQIVLLNTNSERWGPEVDADHQINAGDLLSWFSRRQLLSLLPLLWRCHGLYVIGADIIDGIYGSAEALCRLRLLRLTAQFGCKAVLTGASVSEAAAPEVMDAMRALPEKVVLCARDPVTEQRMEGAIGRQVVLTSDCAFLPAELRPDDAAAGLSGWIGHCRSEGRTVIAVNLNALQVAKQPDLPAAVLQVLERQAAARKLAVLVVPHDTRGKLSDLVLAEQLAEGLKGTQAQVMLVRPPLSPSLIKRVIGDVDLVVTGRMHLAILSLGQAVLPLSIVYHGKFTGLYQLWGLPGDALMLSPQDVAAVPEALSASIDDALAQRDRLRETIAGNLPKVCALADGNFGF